MPTFSCRLRYNLAAFILITTVSSAFAEAAEHADRPPTRGAEADTVAFEIPSQDLKTALTAFAEASGWQLFYSAETAEGRQSPGLSGRYTPEDGLRHIHRSGISDHRRPDRHADGRRFIVGADVPSGETWLSGQ